MPPDGASRVYANARVVTLDGRGTVAEALAVAGERILGTGTAREMRGLAGEEAPLVDLGGRAVVPGLIDTHAHLDREGLKALGPSLAGCRSVADVLEVVREAASAAAAPGEWVVTMPAGTPPHYFDGVESLREGRLPTRQELDRAAPDNPVYVRPIWGYWRHSPGPERLDSAASSRALDLAGIAEGAALPSPNILLHRDPDNGGLDGRITERGSSSMVELVMLDAAARFTARDREAALKSGMAVYNALGTTSVFEGHGTAGEVFRAWRACRAQAAMTVRARLVHSPSWDAVAGADPAEIVRQWAYWAGGIGDPYLSMDGLFVEHRIDPDDKVRARAAPYTGWGGYHYDCALPLDRLKPVLIEAARCGIRCVAIASDMIETFAEIDRIVPLAGRRWVVQHFGPLSPAQCDIAERLGLVLTPLTIRHIYKDGAASPVLAALDDPARFVPMAELARRGIKVTLASDNAPPSLFHSVWHVAARRGRDGNDVPDAGQRLGREAALRCATANGAWLTFEEADKGTLEAGKLADFAVLSDDPLHCADDALPDIRAHLTVVGGRVVHDDGTIAIPPAP